MALCQFLTKSSSNLNDNLTHGVDDYCYNGFMSNKNQESLELIFKDSKAVFEFHLSVGQLSKDEAAKNYAGKWMYMGSVGNVDEFKNMDNGKIIELKGKA